MRKRKILLADDPELFLRLEKTFLHRDEFELITTDSGKKALSLAREMKPDLIFLGLYMQGMNGDECCRTLKEDERYRGIPVVMVTQGKREDDLKRCREAGCDAIVQKPINRHDLLEMTRKFLRIEDHAAPRYSARLLVHYGPDQRRLLSDHSINLSTGGLFLETDHPLKTSTILKLEFIFPDSELRLSCSARVAWSNYPELLQRPELPAGMGLQFLDLTSADRELIRNYLRESNLTQVHASSAYNWGSSDRGKEISKILVADSNSGSMNRLRGILEQASHTVLGSATYEETLALTAAEHPDLVIVNAAMLGKEGGNLCESLAHNRETAHIPVIVLSGWSLSIGNADGLELGASDHFSRPLNENEILAKVEHCLNMQRMSESLFRTRRLLQEKMHETDESLSAAAAIQQSLLPSVPPQGTSFNFAWRFIPCERVGGDLFNVFRLDETHIGAYVLDVSGHGVPAAMVATSVAQALDPFSGQILKRIIPPPPHYELISPAGVLAGLNRDYPIERFGKYLTICYLLLDTQSGKVRYSNAALPLPFLVRADGRIETLGEGGTIIGLTDSASYDEGEITMEPGDRLFLYTDGIVEYQNRGGEFYGEERFIQQLQADSGETLQMTCANAIKSLLGFGNGHPAEDDLTLVGIEFSARVC
ncbi:MAG: SpoIIE family protein phosphatase [Pelobacteraceae bacterium]